MDLRTFIKETLVQIAQGVDDARGSLTESKAIINPRHVAGASGAADSKVYGYLATDEQTHRQVVQSISFDVAVSVAQSSETKGGIGLVVGSVALGSHGKSDESSTSVSRIRFQVPMVLPTDENA